MMTPGESLCGQEVCVCVRTCMRNNEFIQFGGMLVVRETNQVWHVFESFLSKFGLECCFRVVERTVP
jgi:hypothetical protein